MPNYHWEKYSSPELRNPSQNWIFMTYETASNVRLRYLNKIDKHYNGLGAWVGM